MTILLKVFFMGALCLSLIGTGAGCNKLTDKHQSGVYYYGINEIYVAAKNVYIGRLAAIGDIISEERRASADDIYTIEYRHIYVDVVESFKGDFQQDLQADDLLLSTYDDFLEVGATFLFMTGVDYKSTEPMYLGFNIYDAVKIIDFDQIIIYKLNEYRDIGKYRGNNLANPPENLNKIRTIFHEIGFDVY